MLARAGNYVVVRNEEYDNIPTLLFAFSKLKFPFYAHLTELNPSTVNATYIE